MAGSEDWNCYFEMKQRDECERCELPTEVPPPKHPRNQEMDTLERKTNSAVFGKGLQQCSTHPQRVRNKK